MKILIGHTNMMPQILLRKPLPGREDCDDEILAFGNGYTQVSHTPGMTWSELLANCPPNWTPDVYLHWSPEYNAVPLGIENAECFTVGVFGDWNLGGTALRTVGGNFDLLVADAPGCEAFHRAGFTNVLPSLLWGYDPQLHRIVPEAPRRDIDLLMIGSFNHEIQRERSKWLARVARLSQKYRVVLTTGIRGEEYTRMTNRAKIVFNRSIRGELNMRAYEATACGALHFLERGNGEFAQVFEDGVSGVLYGEDDFETLIDHYLAPENTTRREQIAHAGHTAVEAHTFADHLGALLNSILSTDVTDKKADFIHRLTQINTDYEQNSNAQRPTPNAPFSLFYQWLLSSDKRVLPNLDAALETAESTARTDRERGEVTTLKAFSRWQHAANCVPSEEKERTTREAFHLFAKAFEYDPENLLARYNYGYTLVLQGFMEAGISLLWEVLRRIEQDDMAHFTGLALPRLQDGFRLEWEQIFLAHAPNSEGWFVEMRRWLTGRVLLMISETAYAQNDYVTAWQTASEATLQNPVQIPILYAKARAARAMGRIAESLEAYRRTIEESPFHFTAWEERIRLLFEVGKASEAVPLLEDLEMRIRACTYYAPHRPAVLQLLREARILAQQKNNLPDIKRILAFPDWSENGDWRTLAADFAAQYRPTDAVLLMLRADPNQTPLAGVLITNLQHYLLHDCTFPAEEIPAITILNEELTPENEWRLFHLASEVRESGELNPLRRALAEAADLPVIASKTEVSDQNNPRRSWKSAA